VVAPLTPPVVPPPSPPPSSSAAATSPDEHPPTNPIAPTPTTKRNEPTDFLETIEFLFK
jgi:hypothetical protein